MWFNSPKLSKLEVKCHTSSIWTTPMLWVEKKWVQFQADVGLLFLASRMKPCACSRSSLPYQPAQSPAAFLWAHPQPRRLRRGPATRHKVRHICSFKEFWNLISQTEEVSPEKTFQKWNGACSHSANATVSPDLRVSFSEYLQSKSVLVSLLSPRPLTSQTSTVNQEAHSDRAEGFHPAKAADYSRALGSRTSSSAGQGNHHPASADHCAACR